MLAARLEREEEEFRARMERQDREGRERLAMNREATEAETVRRATWGMPGVNPDIETRDEFIGGRLHLPFFDEAREDLDSYLRRFERLASLQKWNRNTWATRLSTTLKGKALEVYNELTDEVAVDYDSLKAALTARFQLSAETYRRGFHASKRKEGETFVQFIYRTKYSFGRWLELAGPARPGLDGAADQQRES